MNDHHEILRLRMPHHHNRVTYVELLYDLVFVFAITQLSHMLMEHFTLGEVAQTVVLLLAVWITWIYTAWTTNWLNPDNYLVRLMLFVLMLAGLFLSASMPEAYGERGRAFAFAYVFMQLCRSSCALWAFRGHPSQFRNFQRIIIWLSITSLFWLVGGFATEKVRMVLWIIAIALEVILPAIRFWLPVWGSSSLTDWEIEGSHMAERCALFIIIALGESLLVTGGIFSELVWDTANVTAFVASFASSLLLWWLYFDRSAAAASRVIAEARDSGRLARSAYTYSHVVLVAGIILLAVADDFVLSHPNGHTDIKTVIALLGGSALYLIGNLLVKWTVWGRIRISHIVGLILLALLIPAASFLSPLWMMCANAVVLLIIATGEDYYYRRYPMTSQLPATAPSE